MNPLLGNTHEFDPDTGKWINSTTRRIGEIIHDYNPEFELAWIPDPGPGVTHPYAVIHNSPRFGSYVVFNLREDELDERIITRLWQGDQGKRDVFGEMQRSQDAAKLLQLKEREDEIEDQKDLIRHVLNSPKARYRHGGKVYE